MTEERREKFPSFLYGKRPGIRRARGKGVKYISISLPGSAGMDHRREAALEKPALPIDRISLTGIPYVNLKKL